MKKLHINLIIILSFLIVFSTVSIVSAEEKSGIYNTLEKIFNLYYDIYADVIKVFKDFNEKNFKPPNYDIQLIDTVIIKDCFDVTFDTKSPCFLVDLDFKNNQSDSITFELTGRTIVTKDGKQLDKYGGFYNTKQLNGLCDTANFFKLFPNANKKVGVCFPVVSKDDAPIMFLGVNANGKIREHMFNLTQYISYS